MSPSSEVVFFLAAFLGSSLAAAGAAAADERRRGHGGRRFMHGVQRTGSSSGGSSSGGTRGHAGELLLALREDGVDVLALELAHDLRSIVSNLRSVTWLLQRVSVRFSGLPQERREPC